MVALQLLYHPFRRSCSGEGADKFDVMFLAYFGEFCILRKETITRVNGICIGDFRGGNDIRDVQIGFCTWRRSDANSFIGKTNMQGYLYRQWNKQLPF